MPDMRIRNVSVPARLVIGSRAKERGLTIASYLDLVAVQLARGSCPWPGCSHTHASHADRPAGAQRKGKPS